MQPVLEIGQPQLDPSAKSFFSPRYQFRLRELTILLSVAFAAVTFGILNPKFFDPETAIAILENAAPDGLILIGMTIVIVCGAFDMSVGSVMAFCGLTAALAMKHGHLPVPLAVVSALAAGGLIGWANGAIITRLKVNPFIATLG